MTQNASSYLRRDDTSVMASPCLAAGRRSVLACTKGFMRWGKQQHDCRDEAEQSWFVEVNWTQECKSNTRTSKNKRFQNETKSKRGHGDSNKKTTENLRRTRPGI